jgi:hypothetical protein
MTYYCGPDAYNRAVARRIQQNRQIARNRKVDAWHAADASRKELCEWLYAQQNGRNEFLRKMADSLMQWGTLTEGQEAAVRRSRDTDATRKAEWDAKRAEESAAAAPLPFNGVRARIEGVVQSIKETFNNYGPVTKVLVQHADGWKVYGNLPSSLAGAQKGDTIAFEAAIAVSEKDAKFGFFSRPTKGQIIARAAVEGIAE